LRPEIQKKIYQTYLEWFNEAEVERRWNTVKDIPWNKVTKGNVPEELVVIVETFTGIELVLPDYITEMLKFHRNLRGMSWFIADWGYEESKHGIVLDRWLIESGSRTEEELQKFQDHVFKGRYITPCRSAQDADTYTMVQELATCISYVKLEKKVRPYEDKALSKLLFYIYRDEMAHYKFNLEITKINMDEDREGTLRDLVNCVQQFSMPSTDLIPNWEEKNEIIQDQDVMNPMVFFESILTPILRELEISKKEWKRFSKELREEKTPALT